MALGTLATAFLLAYECVFLALGINTEVGDLIS